MNNNENLIALECLECQLLLSKCKRRHQQSLACKYTRVCVHTHTHSSHTFLHDFLFLDTLRAALSWNHSFPGFPPDSD